MTDTPKPPEGYPGWLETIIWCQGSSTENRLARAELAALRAKAAAYDEAMRRIVSWSTFDPGKSMVRFINAEIWAGRFVL